ncbi:MAG: TIM barrel protein [Candidatus Marinimicrobia bacterium]|jgi:hydroxypyruvate isomerase|nr:TIM barrel protein [Candidatus Neomarinimicrobiota bacterium]MDP6861129.1 TIM barrel protein [Candidatus Neomarinimicrobiota bacterium]MEC9455994.1 TIM barrel protein [Candidatus Neomarinimicrobiota bacterium]MED5426910.1 TIM barrel protein [Candidatus Neomarinimicrobiota bacterium]|tara:strand:+ start:26 stop:949 length:924 start_codon:yes stop_codon:yes gene_type:complete
MKRRSFLKKGLSLASAPFISSGLLANSISEQKLTHSPFNLNYAPHFGMFKHHAGNDLVDQLQFMHDHGFRSLEDNGMKNRTTKEQRQIAKKMSQLDMTMGVFVAHNIYWQEPNLTTGNKERQDEFVQNVKDSIEVAKRVNATWMTVVPGYVDLGLEMAYQTANVVEALRRACEILEPHGLIIVLEPLNWWANHAGQFLTKIPQAFEICRAVNSPSCKILFDIYHQQITEGNLIPNMDKAWSEIAYFQIGDNPGRKEPTTGEINYLSVFKHIYDKGYKGIMGMEHGNSKQGKDGELAVIKAYRTVDNF